LRCWLASSSFDLRTRRIPNALFIAIAVRALQYMFRCFRVALIGIR